MPTHGIVSSVLIDGDGAYNAFPGYVVLPDGQLLAFYRKGATHLSFDGALYMGRSADGGATWQTGLLHAPSGETNGASNDDVRDCGAVVHSSGRIVVVFDQRASEDATANVTSWVVHSDDGGRAWSEARRLVTGFAGGMGAYEAGPVELPGGSMIVPGHGADAPGRPPYIRVMGSSDRGETWTDTGARIASTAEEVWTEPWICLLGDGRVLMLIRDESSFVAQASWSEDGGRSWTSPTPALHSCNSRPACITVAGEVLAIYRARTGSAPAYSRSRDGGATWQPPTIWSQPGAGGSFLYSQWQSDELGGLTAVMAQERSGIDDPADLWFLGFDELAD